MKKTRGLMSLSAPDATMLKVISRNVWFASGSATIMFVGGGGGREDGEQRDRPEQAEDADAAGLQRHELAVGRQAAEPDQDPESSAIGIVTPSACGQQRQQDAQDDRPGDALGDQLLGVLQDRRHHQDEGEADQRQQQRRHDLAHEIAVENLQRLLDYNV